MKKISILSVFTLFMSPWTFLPADFLPANRPISILQQANPSGFSEKKESRITTVPLNATKQKINQDEDLAEILANAKDGDTVNLSSGTYTLHETLVITKSLAIIGAGSDETIIMSDAPPQDIKNITEMLRFEVDGTITLEGLSLQSRIDGPSLLLRVKKNSQVNTKDSNFEITQDKYPGFGLVAEDSSRVLVENCTFRGIQQVVGAVDSSNLTVSRSQFVDTKFGVYSDEKSSSRLTINDNTFSDMERGIFITGSSESSINRNKFENLEVGSIILNGKADATITENQIKGGKAGILVKSTGTKIIIEKNEILDSRTGIIITENSLPTIRENIIQAKPEEKNVSMPGGILYQKKSGGEASNNTISGFYLGIAVTDSAKPDLNGNVFHQNEIAVALADQSAAIVRQNQIIETQLTSNSEEGIRFSGQAKGQAIGNSISGLAIGIYVEKEANVILEENTLVGNVEGGIKFNDKAKGVVRRNNLTNCGISVGLLSSATIEENTLQVNIDDTELTGISVSRPVEIRKNKITGFRTAIIAEADRSKPKSQASMVIEGNILRNNPFGIYYTYGGSGVIRNNSIFNSKNAIQISKVLGIADPGYQVKPVVEGNIINENDLPQEEADQDVIKTNVPTMAITSMPSPTQTPSK